MKRRNFIAGAAVSGLAGIAGGCSTARQSRRTAGPSGAGFDIHPFVKAHPEAVFVMLTDVDSKKDTAGMRSSGAKLASEVFVKTPSDGYPASTKVTIKANWTCAGPQDGKPVFEKLGVNTDPHFVMGMVDGMRGVAPTDYYIRECACPDAWEDMGWVDICRENNVDLRDLESKDYWEYKRGDIHFKEVPDGVMFKEVGFMSPMNEDGTFLLNIAKMKAHGMGITATIKNLQGITGRKFHQFCNRYDSIRKDDRYARYLKFFQNDFEKNIETNYARHLKEGIPRWDKPGGNGGIWQETWVQRMLDSFSITRTGLNVVEGIYSQDGNGFGAGPYDPLGPYKVTSRDHMSNVLMFGMDPFRVDIVTHWMAGHEPGNFGLFHIGIERGLSDVLDPADIPVYIWKDGRAELTSLEKLPRTPLVTYYLTRDYGGQNEPRYHLCDEPFDYSAWKRGARVGDCTPSIRELGRDARNRAVMELDLPRRDNVHVDVLDRHGRLVWRLMAEDMDPGVHQVVWDGFDMPGIYNVYVKGMGWDAERQIVTYS